MTAPWTPVILVDIIGSFATLIIAVLCAYYAKDWTQKKTDDVFRNYIFLLTLAIVLFAVSRSFGHLVKQYLLIFEMPWIWKSIAPFSGAINTVTFIIIFAFGVYFHRFQRIHQELDKYRNHLELQVEKRTFSLQQEIGERQQAEQALRKSEKKYRALIETTDTGFVIIDRHGFVLDANEEYVRLAGFQNLVDIIGRNVIDWTAEHDKERNILEVRKCFADGYVRNLEIDYVTQEGAITPVEINATVILQDEGKIVLTLVRNILDRRQTAHSLAAEKERLMVTLKSINDGVIALDIHGNIILLNSAAEKLTGYSETKAVGKSLLDIVRIIDPITRKPKINTIDQILKTGHISAQKDQALLVSDQGIETPISESGSPILDHDHAIIGAVLVLRDMSERNKLEEEFLKARKLEAVGKLAGGIAHDFNNILVAILGNIDIATLSIPDDHQAYPLLEKAEKACYRAQDLTNQLLTFAQGGIPILEAASIKEVIIESAEFVLHGNTTNCSFDIAENLWNVSIDKKQMGQVIQNIIINAAQAMQQGGTIQIACKNTVLKQSPHIPLPAGDYIQINIADQGIGIPHKIIDKIFDPYFSSKPEGSGLGLAITHSIISKHQGYISVDSQPGSGTTFTIYIPAARQPSSIQNKETGSKILPEHARILVMDDEEGVLQVTERMLSRIGFETTLTENGEEAISQFEIARQNNLPYDMVIMDLTIPGGMGGQEAVKEILSLDPQAKVVVVSGYSNDPVMANFKEYGFCATMQKPFTFEELKKNITDNLGE